jgi:hypothetical protein
MGPHTEGKIIETVDLEIQREIFQDSSSPLLLCVSLILVTEQLDKLDIGYEEHAIKTKYYTYFTWMI